MNFKNIHIGSVIQEQVKLQQIAMQKICKFFDCSEEEVEMMYQKNSLDAEILLKWSMLLK